MIDDIRSRVYKNRFTPQELEQDGQDYCAICYDCVDKLVKKYSRKVLTR